MAINQIRIWETDKGSKGKQDFLDMWKLKGQSHGHTIIFKGLKMTFREKILKKNYTTLISIKNTTNFVLTTFPYDNFFFDRALDHGQAQF